MDEPHDGAEPKDLEPRPPLEADLVALCRQLNQRGARYVVIGGFAIITAGLPRATGDIDLLVAIDQENEAKVFPPYPRCRTMLFASYSPGNFSCMTSSAWRTRFSST